MNPGGGLSVKVVSLEEPRVAAPVLLQGLPQSQIGILPPILETPRCQSSILRLRNERPPTIPYLVLTRK